jgi:hypothetical protein
MDTITNQELNQKTLFYHKDGLLDIFAGCLLLFFAISILTGLFFMAGIWAAILAPLWVTARKTITWRRIPPEDIASQSRTPTFLALAGLAGLALLGVISGILIFLSRESLPALRVWLGAYFELAFGVCVALVFTGAAFLLRLGRFAAYALLAVIVFGIAYLQHISFWVPLALLGGLVILAGSLTLARFLARYPELR